MRGNGIAGKAFSGEGCRRGQESHRARSHRGTVSVLALVGVCVLSFATTQMAGAQPVADTVDTGFVIPFAGAPGYESVAPTQMTTPDQLNQPLGQQTAEEIAAQIGLEPADALTEEQYRDLISGGGVGGNREDAAVIDECARILTNTNGRAPLFRHDAVGSGQLRVVRESRRIAGESGQRGCADATGEYADRPWRFRGHLVAQQRCNAHSDCALSVGIHGAGSLRICSATDFGSSAAGGQYQRRCEFGSRHVDGAAALDSELRTALHLEAVTGGGHACALGSHSAGRCRRRESESHRSSRFQ